MKTSKNITVSNIHEFASVIEREFSEIIGERASSVWAYKICECLAENYGSSNEKGVIFTYADVVLAIVCLEMERSYKDAREFAKRRTGTIRVVGQAYS